MNKELLTAQELAGKLDLSVETIWRYTREDKIPAITIGTRQYRYNLKDVLRSLDTNAPRDAALCEAKSKYSVKAHTYEDYAALPSEPGYTIQLIDGSFVKEPGPILQHQRVSGRLQWALLDYFSKINPQGELFCSPIDLVLSEHSTVQPDLVYIEDAAELQNPKYIDIVPKLIIEILSPSSRRTDTISKLNLYLKHGVLHYWIVEPEEGTIEAYKLENDKYVIITAEDGDFQHPDFPGIAFNMQELVKRPL